MKFPSRWFLVIGVILLASSGAGMMFWKWQNFQYNALDTAIFFQTIFNTAQGRFFELSIHPQTYLGDHFSPLLLVPALIFRILPAATTLFGLQAAALFSGIFPLTKLAQKLSPHRRLLLQLLYFFSPLLFSSWIFEFHDLSFIPVLALWALYFYQERRIVPFCIFLLLIFLVREDMGLFGLAFSVLAFFDRRAFAWKMLPGIAGFFSMGLGIFLIQYFSIEEQYKFQIYYHWIGETPHEFLWNAIENPFKILFHFLQLRNLLFIVAILATTGFLALRSFRALSFAFIPALPFLLLSRGAGEIALNTHYSVVVIPGLFFATIAGLSHKELWVWPKRISDPALSSCLIGGIILYTFFTLHPLPQTLWVKPDFPDPQASALRKAVEWIPKNHAVAGSFRVLAPLSFRQNLFSLHYHAQGTQQFSSKKYSIPKVDSVIYDATDALTYAVQFPNSQNETGYRLHELLFDHDLHLVGAANNVTLWQKDSRNPPTELYTLTNKPEGFRPIKSQGSISLIGVRQHAVTLPHDLSSPSSILPLTLIWQKESSLQKPLLITIAWGDQNRMVQTLKSPLAYGLLSLEDWPQDQTLETTHWLTVPSTPVTHLRITLQTYDGFLGLSAWRSAELQYQNLTTVMPTVTIPLSSLRRNAENTNIPTLKKKF